MISPEAKYPLSWVFHSSKKVRYIQAYIATRLPSTTMDPVPYAMNYSKKMVQAPTLQFLSNIRGK